MRYHHFEQAHTKQPHQWLGKTWISSLSLQSFAINGDSKIDIKISPYTSEYVYVCIYIYYGYAEHRYMNKCVYMYIYTYVYI